MFLSKKTLLLNSNYEVLDFIDERKVIKFLIKEKAEVISHWHNEKIYLNKSNIYFPAIMRMRNIVKRRPIKKIIFSRKTILKRDSYQCQYCGYIDSRKNITVDHIVPRSRGGMNSFANCVAACRSCNIKKGNKTPEEAGMRLLREPFLPKDFIYFMPELNFWHEEWDFFLKRAKD